MGYFIYHGSDEDHISWSTPSWTRPTSGLWHVITLFKTGERAGIFICSCEDAICRKKASFVLDKEDHGCKHIKRVKEMCEGAIAMRISVDTYGR